MARELDDDVVGPWVLARHVVRRPLPPSAPPPPGVADTAKPCPPAPPGGGAGPPADPGDDPDAAEQVLEPGAVRPWQLGDCVHRVPDSEPGVA